MKLYALQVIYLLSLAFWTCFKWWVPPISCGNTPLSWVVFRY